MYVLITSSSDQNSIYINYNNVNGISCIFWYSIFNSYNKIQRFVFIYESPECSLVLMNNSQYDINRQRI